MKFRNRNFVSVTITVGFLSVAITGLLYFFGIKSDAVEVIHVLFGLIFVFFTGFHIWYNFSSLKNYVTDGKKNTLKKEMLFSMMFSIILLAFMCFGGGVATSLAESGRQLFSDGSHKGKNDRHRNEGIVFAEINTNDNIKKGTSLEIMVHKTNNIVNPTIVIWAEALNDEYFENLFVPTKILDVSSASSVNDLLDLERPNVKKSIKFLPFDSKIFPEYRQRNSALAPTFNGATPVTSFFLKTNTSLKGRFMIYLEINYKKETELYHAIVDTDPNNIFLLRSSESNLIIESIIRIV